MIKKTLGSVYANMMNGNGHINYARQFTYTNGCYLSTGQYHKYKKYITQTAKKKFEEHLPTIQDRIREFYKDVLGITPDDKGILNIEVSSDGSWHIRGHHSPLGCTILFDVYTGLPVDYYIASKICQKCTSAKNKLKKGKMSKEEYNDWQKDHKKECKINFTLKSSGDMERVANVIMFKRSIEKNKFRYTGLVSDGDTNTYNDICKARPYGAIKIVKLECVNHVGKRVNRGFTDLVKTKVFYLENESEDDCDKEMPTYGPSKCKKQKRNAGKTRIKDVKKVTVTKAKKKSKGRVVSVNHMGGRHGINAKFIRCVQGYYTYIIKQHDSVEGMQHALRAMAKHITSTDANPKHEDCPEHRPNKNPNFKSYCFWKRYEWRLKCEKTRWYRMQLNNKLDQEEILPETSENARRYYGKSMPNRPFTNKFKSKLKVPLHSSMNVRLRFAEGSVEYELFMKVMDKVSDEDLLKRCLGNKTQNMNESFHQRVWNMCKKDKHFEADQLEFSICQNALIHTLGYEHGSLLKSFGINITKSVKALWNVQEKARTKLKPLKAKYRRQRDIFPPKPGQEGYDDDGGSQVKSYNPGGF